MRSLGDSTYFLKAAYEPLREIMGNKKYEMKKDPIKGIIVHTDRIEGELLENVNDFLNNGFGSNFRKTHYNHHIEVDWRDITRFGDCVYKTDVLAATPNGSLGELVTSDGYWVYPLPKCDDVFQFAHQGSAPTIASKLKHIDVDGSLFGKFGGYWVSQSNVFGWCGKLETVKITNYKPTYMNVWFEQCTKLRHVDVDYSGMTTAGSNLAGCFRGCILDKWSVLKLNETLPVCHTNNSNKNITLGIHIDYQNDEEVLAAITNAESKGWTLTVQWNGTPTAHASVTYGLRKPPIYVRVDKRELPDGAMEQNLDWGHYVTNPEDYQEFSSLEEAYEHFGLPNDLKN